MKLSANVNSLKKVFKIKLRDWTKAYTLLTNWWAIYKKSRTDKWLYKRQWNHFSRKKKHCRNYLIKTASTMFKSGFHYKILFKNCNSQMYFSLMKKTIIQKLNKLPIWGNKPSMKKIKLLNKKKLIKKKWKKKLIDILLKQTSQKLIWLILSTKNRIFKVISKKN